MHWRFSCLAGAALLACASPPSRAAEAYPARPVRVLVQYVPGGNVDTAARAVARELSNQLGQQFIVDNRPGGGGSIAYQALAASTADGYTLGIGHIGQLALNPHLLGKLPYDPLKDFTAITRIADAPNLLVSAASFPAANLEDLVAYARSHPGKLAVANAGVGTVGFLAGELLSARAGVSIVPVPYKGSAQLTADLIAGNVQAAFGGPPALLPHVKTGRLHALAVTGAKRSPAFPDLPTVAELGYPGFQAVAWMGLIGPAGLDDRVVDLLSRETHKALTAEELKRLFAANGFDVVASTPEEFSAFIRSEYQSWGEFIQARGIHGE